MNSNSCINALCSSLLILNTGMYTFMYIYHQYIYIYILNLTQLILFYSYWFKFLRKIIWYQRYLDIAIWPTPHCKFKRTSLYWLRFCFLCFCPMQYFLTCPTIVRIICNVDEVKLFLFLVITNNCLVVNAEILLCPDC